MASQVVQGWHPNPQLMQPPQAPPPQGWTGSWPPGSNVAFPPGYPGPPPVPGGAAHPHWNAGFWRYNPLGNVQNPQQPWAPGVGWFPPNYNPYKRVPKPPSPSYWNTKLSDNGLGLEGMVKRRDPAEYDGEEPHTPWIWNPPSLLESGERATPARDFNPRRSGSADPTSHQASTPTREYGQSSRGPSQDNQNAQAHVQTPDRKSTTRGGYFYNVQDNAGTPSGPTRHSSEPTDFRSGQSSASGPSTSSQRTIAQTDSWSSSRSRSHPLAANEVPPFPAPTPTISRSASAQQSVYTQEPESFTSRGELQPTFSSSIIRTPTHYQQTRRSMEEPAYSRSPSSGGHGSTPSRGQSAPEALARQSSLPHASSSSRDVFSNFSEDMSNSLNASTSSRAGQLSRSRTEPVVPGLTTIHESASALSSGELYLAPLRDPSSSTESSPNPSPHRRERRASPYAGSPRSPEPSPMYRERERRASPFTGRQGLSLNTNLGAHSRSGSHPHPQPHAQPRSQPHSRSHSQSHSPSPSPHARAPDSYGSRRDNPLPAPPVERAHPESTARVQERSPPHYTHKVRAGFWNRRGDHLTQAGFVVYAPQSFAYPAELRDYPDEREGYRDPYGAFVGWREDRPELPASLPSRGRAPAQPYESFVVYTYLQ